MSKLSTRTRKCHSVNIGGAAFLPHNRKTSLTDIRNTASICSKNAAPPIRQIVIWECTNLFRAKYKSPLKFYCPGMTASEAVHKPDWGFLLFRKVSNADVTDARSVRMSWSFRFHGLLERTTLRTFPSFPSSSYRMMPFSNSDRKTKWAVI